MAIHMLSDGAAPSTGIFWMKSVIHRAVAHTESSRRPSTRTAFDVTRPAMTCLRAGGEPDAAGVCVRPSAAATSAGAITGASEPRASVPAARTLLGRDARYRCLPAYQP